MTELRLTGDWKRMAMAVDPERLHSNLLAYVGRATQFNGMYVQSVIRQRIKGRKYAPGSPLTALLKGSSTPLIDDANLFGAITSQAIDPFSVFIGVLRTAMTADGKPMIKLAEMLHSGAIIPVTQGMRNLFELLCDVGQGRVEASKLEGRAAEMAQALGSAIKLIRPFKSSTTFIHIPARPFIKDVLNDPAVQRKVGNNWIKAVKAAIKDQSSGKSGQGGSGSSQAVKTAATVQRNKRAPTAKKRRTRDRGAAARKGWKTRRAKQSGGTS